MDSKALKEHSLVLLFFVATLCSVSVAQQPAPVSPRVGQFFENRQYGDAIRGLQDEIKGRPEETCGRHFLMLGECHYLTGQYAEARPWFSKAVRTLPEGREKMMAEHRLAAALFRLGDLDGASEKIAAFSAKYPNDPILGKMLVYRMMILARRGKEGEAEITALHKRIRDNIGKFNHSTGMEADQALCEYYRGIGQVEKAVDVYTRIVQNFQNVMAELRNEGKPIPAGFEKAHDNAALQLGALYADRKQSEEARRWLENVRYDVEMKQKARLLLAKLQFERNDFDGVVRSLGEPGFMDTVPAGPARSDLFLMLGMAEKYRGESVSKIEEYLRQVESSSKGYRAAQAVLADLYREKGLSDSALKAYLVIEGDPDYAASALFYIGGIYMDQADKAGGAAATELYRKASDKFSQLFTRYPLSPLIRQARDKAELLAKKGIDVSFAHGDDENRAAWEKAARDKKGAVEGAQALLSLIRMHAKGIVDEKTGHPVKPPNYAACASACDQFLDDKTYTGLGFEAKSWTALKAEVLYHRAQCEIASVSPPKETQTGQARPTLLPGASATRAAAFFAQARETTDPRLLDQVKGIELGLLESLFKSDRKEHREEAEKKFAQLEADYGADPRFQKLALDLAQWYQDQKRYADAARQYAAIADRGRDFPDEDRLRLLFSAGNLYSKAAQETLRRKDAVEYAIQIYPKEIIDLGDDIRKTYAPFQRMVDIEWPTGQPLTARDALLTLSKAARISFVWAPEEGPNTVESFLKGKKVALKDGSVVIDQALQSILDVANHRLVLDIGVTGGTPTLPPPTLNNDDPDAERSWKVIEIVDVRQADNRFKPLTRPFGVWNQVYSGKSAMLFSILQKIEAISATRIVWTDGIEKEDKLAGEYTAAPGLNPNSDATLLQVLRAVLDPRDLRFRVIQREQAADLYEKAKDQFSKIRQIAPKSGFGEKSLFTLAINYYNQQDYEKMKLVLREYLKVFDNPSHEYYRQACFWVGWAYENGRHYREACDYYSRAAEERLVFYQPTNGAPRLSRETMKNALAYDTQFALMEPVAGEFVNRSPSDLADFIRLNAHVQVRLDNSVGACTNSLQRDAFKAVPAYEVLCDALDGIGLAFRVENMDPETSERAYFRLASSYKKDNLMPQALENCRVLLARYPATVRRRDTLTLMLDIYKGLKDYRNVLATLEDLTKTAGDEIEKYKFDFEIASIYFDMADYAKAAETFRGALASAKRAQERLTIRDACAKALYRAGKQEEALAQYETLAKEETDPLRVFEDRLLIFYLRFALGKAEEREFPEEADRFLMQYEKLGESERGKVSPEVYAKATWIYYIKALIDLKKGRHADAVARLNAATRSPDDFLAADAAYTLGRIAMKNGDFQKARELFEYLLFATRSPESAVRATFSLGQTLEAMNLRKEAAERYAQLIDRYPISPFVGEIMKSPVYPDVMALKELNLPRKQK
ncbi:MAG: tetratricopeptide repeat protein [bacterium]